VIPRGRGPDGGGRRPRRSRQGAVRHRARPSGRCCRMGVRTRRVVGLAGLGTCARAPSSTPTAPGRGRSHRPALSFVAAVRQPADVTSLGGVGARADRTAPHDTAGRIGHAERDKPDRGIWMGRKVGAVRASGDKSGEPIRVCHTTHAAGWHIHPGGSRASCRSTAGPISLGLCRPAPRDSRAACRASADGSDLTRKAHAQRSKPRSRDGNGRIDRRDQHRV